MVLKKSVNWTPEMLSLIGTMSDADVAKRIGSTTTVVQLKRIELGIPHCGNRVMNRQFRHLG
jgi:hypothetical protein